MTNPIAHGGRTFDACSDPGVQAIVIRDGPRVEPDAFGAIDRATNDPLVTALMAGCGRGGTRTGALGTQ
ncbi:hypothetical protein LVJ94_39630 [Pendulispora rubella]|uniref:Uncharacterized protein n=1 Tax=Pendulispora rubella TaxID=2741070 RepID=A0ABZ2KWF3_9BACT